MPDCSNWSNLWFNGQEIDKSCLLWGVKLLWWARLGKFVQFVAGLLILADIVGIERIRKWGKSLDNLINSFNLKTKLNIFIELFSALFSKLKLLFKLYLYIILGQWQPFSRLQPSVFSKNYINKTMFFALFIGLWILIFGFLQKNFLLLISDIIKFIIRLISFILLYPVAAVLFWYILMILSYLIIAVIIFIIKNIFIKSLAWLLERPRLDRIVQIISLILFVVGTIIDFIAS